MRALVIVVLAVGVASAALAGEEGPYTEGLVAHYYQDPQYWGGNWPDDVSVPTVNAASWTFTTYAYSRVEPLINHLFIRNGWFSIRWVGYINVLPGATGGTNPDKDPNAPVEVGFDFWADDGARIFIDGKKVIDDWTACWQDLPRSHRKATVTLTPGYHPIVIEYFQGQSLQKDDADPAKLSWTIEGRREIVPASQFFHKEADLNP